MRQGGVQAFAETVHQHVDPGDTVFLCDAIPLDSQRGIGHDIDLLGEAHARSNPRVVPLRHARRYAEPREGVDFGRRLVRRQLHARQQRLPLTSFTDVEAGFSLVVIQVSRTPGIRHDA